MNMNMLGIGGGRMPDFSAMRDKLFQKADGNNDQAISLEEFQSAGKNMPGGKIGDADKAREAFGKIDDDGNGSLSREEMSRFTSRMSLEMQGAMVNMQAMMGGGIGGGGMGGMMGGGAPSLEDMFGKADDDGDGAVSRAEFDKGRDANPMARLMGQSGDDVFGRIDGDGDGSLSREEMTAFTAQAQQRMQGAAGGREAEFMQAMSAYTQGSGSSSADLTDKLLKMLDNSQSAQSRRGVTA